MHTHSDRASRPRGFTLVELLVIIAILALGAGATYAAYLAFISKQQARQAATQAKVIHGWLIAWANDNGNSFPKGDNANEAYRELFKIKVGADERKFGIPGDAYHQVGKGAEPDGDAGQAPEFTRALEKGECAFAYVSGLMTSDSARLPLVANGFTAQPGVWCKDKKAKGGVFGGKYGVVCRVGGSAVAHELKEGRWMVEEKSNGLMVNIFSAGFEDMNFDVLNPL